MGIYFGCYCFNMTNGHASSCVAQFIYADIIGPLKWNMQWAICQKFKADLTWSLLQSYSFCVLDKFTAKCKLDEYSWVGDIVIRLRKEATWYSKGNTSSCISLVFFWWLLVGETWKVEKKIFLVSDVWKRGRFPKCSHWRVSWSEGHWALTCRLLERNHRMSFLRDHGEQCTRSHFQVLVKPI